MLAIGLILNDLSMPNSPLWHGALDVAEERGVNLLCFSCTSGVTIDGLAGPDRLRLYDLAKAEGLDGLVIWSGAMNAFLSRQEIQDLCECYRPLPMVSIALELDRIPSLILDNAAGMTQAMHHLIEVHGYRRIALVRGPEGHQEADIRFQTYLQMLSDYGIPFDPSLIQPGSFDPDDGSRAVHVLHESNTDFDALLTMDDSVALSAMNALQDGGIQVAKDIAIVGFDDQDFSRYTTPPLTTVRISTYDQGRRAMELVLAQLAGETVPLQIPFIPKLVVRESCGCISNSVAEAATYIRTGVPGTRKYKWTAAQKRILKALQDTPSITPAIRRWLPAWVESFMKAVLNQGSRYVETDFLHIFVEILHETIDSPELLSNMDLLLSAFRREALPYMLQPPRALAAAEDLWHQARVMITEASRRLEAYQRLESERLTGTLLEIDEALIVTISKEQLMDEISLLFPRVSIQSCYISLYQNPLEPSDGALLNLAFENGEQLELPPDEIFFPPSKLTPNMRWRDRKVNWIIQPLNYTREQMGFVVFQVGSHQGIIYEALRGQLSSALKGAQLHAELSLTDSLTRVYNRRYFEIFMQKEIDRARRYNRSLAVIMIDMDYFKDYNDQFGHLAGDAALQKIAEGLQASVRRGLDVVVRYGGDEFAVILSETDAKGACVVAENIRTTLENDPRIFEALTLSMGISALKGENADAKRLVSEADRALYQAKHLGRNQITIYQDKNQVVHK